MTDIICPIVIDVGSSCTKAGFAGDEGPCVVTPTLVGHPKQRNVMPWINKKSAFVGVEAQLKRGISTINYPIRRGCVTNWDDFEQLMQVTFEEELCVESDEQPLVLTETPYNPRANTEGMVELMFEKFNIPALHVTCHSVMYAVGRTTGTIIDCGDGVTSIVPVYDGNTFAHASKRINLGGSDCTDYLRKTLTERGYFFHTKAEREIVANIKETLAYVSLDYNSDLQLARDSTVFEKEYELPDGTHITLGAERFRCAEILFHPGMITSTLPGIHEIIFKSIKKCDIDVRKDLLNNIVLTGGSTMFPNLDERLKHELKMISPGSDVKVVAMPERTFSKWIGASILASLSTFLQLCLMREDYEEYGPEMIHRKGKDTTSLEDGV